MENQLTIFHYWIMTASAVSLFVSFVALLISWVNARRTNASVLRILKASGHTTCEARRSADSAEPLLESHRFAVWVNNLGLPLHDVRVWLRLVCKDGSGTMCIEMTRYAMDDEHVVHTRGELGKGMVGMFEIRSDDKCMKHFRLPPVETDRYLDIEAAGYNVQSFRIGGWRDKLAADWNRVAYRINRRFDKRGTTHTGRAWLKPGNMLPVFRDVDSSLRYFLASLPRQSKHDGGRPPKAPASHENSERHEPHPAPDGRHRQSDRHTGV